MNLEDVQREGDALRNLLNNKIKSYDSITGEVLSHGDSFEDFGDFVPSLHFLGMNELLDDQYSSLVDHLQSVSFLYRNPIGGIQGLLCRSYSQTDLLWGLVLYLKKLEVENPVRYSNCSQEVKVIFDVVVDSFLLGREKIFLLNELPIFSQPIPVFLRNKLNIPMLSSQDHGMFIELLVFAYEIYGEDRYIEIATKIADDFLFSRGFQINGFFSFYEPNSFFSRLVEKAPPFRKKRYQFQLLKQNSNTLFGLFKLGSYKKSYREKFYVIIDQLMSRFYSADERVFYTNFHVRSKKTGADLTVFHMIELLVLANRSEEALNIYDGYVAHQDDRTGLLPFYHPVVAQEITRFSFVKGSSWLDALIDFSVAALKLHVNIGRRDILDTVKRIYFGILNYHRTEYGYMAEYDFENHTVLNPVYSAKMTALVLKLPYALKRLENINDMDSLDYLMLQDR